MSGRDGRALLDGAAPEGRVKTVLRVLLVDDEDDMRVLARTALEESGSFIVVAEGSNGAEAVTAAIRERADIVLLDLEMPWLDGAEAVPMIRDGAPESFIVLWTVSPDSPRAYEALAMGASAVVDKAGVRFASLSSELLRLYTR